MSEKQDIFLCPGWAMPFDVYKPLIGDGECLDLGFFHQNSLIMDIDETIETIARSGAEKHVVAHSLGSALALKATLEGGDFLSLTLIAGFARFAADESGLGQSPGVIRAMKRGLKSQPKKVLEDFYALMGYPSDWSIPVIEEMNTEALAVGLDILGSIDLRQTISDINIPTLVIYGEQDRVVPPKLSKNLGESISFSRVASIVDGGHALPFTHTIQCRRLMEDFS